MLLFAAGVALVAGLAAGLAPAVHLLRADVNAVVRAGASRSATAGRARAASRLLVVSEVALALALVTTAGLMTKSLLRLQDQDLGMTRGAGAHLHASACRRSSPPTTPRSCGSRAVSSSACGPCPA